MYVLCEFATVIKSYTFVKRIYVSGRVSVNQCLDFTIFILSIPQIFLICSTISNGVLSADIFKKLFYLFLGR